MLEPTFDYSTNHLNPIILNMADCTNHDSKCKSHGTSQKAKKEQEGTDACYLDGVGSKSASSSAQVTSEHLSEVEGELKALQENALKKAPK